ncbi:DUF4232 domain-containing protein [Streptomyces sp. NPDC019396]|uniref:DUF4232 domain-containing protein n=1 Tax=Streptomyces sp. NPDC019396 TaxID=3154687 RepID=UPI0033C7B079
MTTLRTRTAIATAALVAGLSLTACQNDDAAGAAVPAGSAANAGSSSTAGSGGAKASAGTTGTAGTGGSTASAGNSGSSASGKTTSGGGSSQNAGGGNGGADSSTCTTANTRVVVSKVSRPVNHMLLTITNTGTKSCSAYNAPLLRFDEAQAATQINEDSKPQAVVTLAPGESAYASILLSSAAGDGEGGGDAKKLSVHFAQRDGGGSAGNPVTLNLPAGTYTDSTASVSYWQSDMQDALTF